MATSALRSPGRLALLTCLVGLGLANLVLAQEPAESQPTIQELNQRIKELEALVRQLHQNQQATQPIKAVTEPQDPNGEAPASPDGQEGEPGAAPETAPAAKKTAAPPADIQALAKRLLALEQDKEKAAAASKRAAEDWQDMSKEGWNVRLGGHIQMDYITWPQVDPAITSPDARNYFNFRRLRLTADGTGYGVYDFRLQVTLEPGEGPINNFATADVKDAYFSINEVPLLGRVRVGNFFVPFSLEQVTNDTFNIFLERSIPTQGIFAADREVGVALYNCTADQNLSWSAGMFFDNFSDTVKTRIDNNQGYRLTGRLVYLPYYDEPSQGRYLVHTGIGVLHTHDHDDRTSFRARPQIQRGPILIDSGVLDAGYTTTANLEFAVVLGRVTLQSEAFLCRVARDEEPQVNIGGAYAHLSYFLTGESRFYERFSQHGAHFGRNKPFTNVFFTRGGAGWGAWEAKARWSYLDLLALQAGQYNDFTLGFNWYWSDRTRIMFDWIHPMTTEETVFGTTRSDIVGMRFDVNW